MTDAEEKAEEWAYDKVKELMLDGTIPADAGTLEIAEYGYLAGYAEAMRWRKCSEEMPEVGEVVQIFIPRSQGDTWHVVRYFQYQGTWQIMGRNATHWREIGPLPGEEK